MLDVGYLMLDEPNAFVVEIKSSMGGRVDPESSI
jgi:hypothetical protein